MCRPTPLVLTTLLVAILTAPVVAQANSGNADAREIQAYRLSMAKLNQLNQAMLDWRRQRDADPARVQLLSKKKELATLSEKEEPTAAEQQRMERLAADIEEAERADDEADDDDKDQSLSDLAQRMTADPRIAGALKRANLGAREAATMQLSLFQVAFAVGMLESGSIKEIPKDVNPDNVKFYRANRAAIAALAALKEQDD